VAAAYGANYDRLAQIKNQYDPDNLFHQNIKPSPRQATSYFAGEIYEHVSRNSASFGAHHFRVCERNAKRRGKDGLWPPSDSPSCFMQA
jgi:Berberine and berberine like